MRCPYCGTEDAKVVDSRSFEDGCAIKRRRQCLKCLRRFTTYEKIETFPVMVIKKDDTREAYDRSKLEAGIIHACHKRPVSAAQITEAIDLIESRIFAMEEKEVHSSVIGEMVMERLKELDDVAFVRFASVYRDFKDVESFQQELNLLRDGKTK